MKAITLSNRVVRVTRLGGPDVLQISHEPVGEPATGELRLRVHALGLNRAEVMFRTGNYTKCRSSQRASALRRRVLLRL